MGSRALLPPLLAAVLALSAGCGDDTWAGPNNGSETFGEACDVDGECLDGLCVTDPIFPGGFCTLSCSPGDDFTCGDPTLACVVASDRGAVCLLRCGDDGDCPRDGYRCDLEDGRRVCLGGL
jgi:hypothetical protein